MTDSSSWKEACQSGTWPLLSATIDKRLARKRGGERAVTDREGGEAEGGSLRAEKMFCVISRTVDGDLSLRWDRRQLPKNVLSCALQSLPRDGSQVTCTCGEGRCSLP